MHYHEIHESRTATDKGSAQQNSFLSAWVHQVVADAVTGQAWRSLATVLDTILLFLTR
jgi:hypothetical protein